MLRQRFTQFSLEK